MEKACIVKELVYEWQGHKLYLANGHYVVDSEEDFKSILAHLRDIQRSTLLSSEENKLARWLVCDLFIRKCYAEVEES